MANKKKQTKNKKNKSKKGTAILSILLILVLAAGGFIYYRYFYNPEANNTTYSSEQNAEGYYYVSDIPNNSYYYDAKGKVSDSLESSLNVIIKNGYVSVSYSQAKTALAESDKVVENDKTYLYGIYDSQELYYEWSTEEQKAWEREHVWPNSRLGMNRVTESGKNQASDLHNLRAIGGTKTGGVNQSRSNRYFVEKTNTNSDGRWETVGSEGFYPGDEHKGDVARILFYMVIMYDYLSLIEDENKLTDYETYTIEGANMGLLSVLLKWHKEDPVSDFERGRNNVIETYQKNRNPFIDHPEFVHLIFEGKTINDLTKVDDSAKNMQVIYYKEEYSYLEI